MRGLRGLRTHVCRKKAYHQRRPGLITTVKCNLSLCYAGSCSLLINGGVSLTLKVPLLHNVALVIYSSLALITDCLSSYIFLFLSATPHHLLIPTWLALNAIY